MKFIIPYRTKQKKDKVVTARFTEKEKRKIKEIMEKTNLPLSYFVRNAVFFYIKELNLLKERDSKEKILDKVDNLRKRIKNLKEILSYEND
jgi:IS4 transposase